jgi:hypothetical protein
MCRDAPLLHGHVPGHHHLRAFDLGGQHVERVAVSSGRLCACGALELRPHVSISWRDVVAGHLCSGEVLLTTAVGHDDALRVQVHCRCARVAGILQLRFCLFVWYLRPALRELVELSSRLADAASAKKFAELFFTYKTVYESHACYEDGILFPAMEELFPGVTEPVQQDHMKDSVAVQELAALVAQLVPSVPPSNANTSYISVEYKLHTHSHRAAPTPAEDAAGSSGQLADRVQQAIVAMAAAHNKHFDLEEEHIAPVARKYIPIQRAKVTWFACGVGSGGACTQLCCVVMRRSCPARCSRRCPSPRGARSCRSL